MLEQEMQRPEVWEEAGPDVDALFPHLENAMDAEEYNYEHFRTGHFAYDVKATMLKLGIRPGDMAPDFTLHFATGGTGRLSDFRGRPVLLHFGSPT